MRESELEEATKELSEKESHLANLEKSLTFVESYLQQVNADLERAKLRYDAYKDTVRNVVESVSNYGPGYAKGLVESPSGQNKIREILIIEDKRRQKEELERFVLTVSKQAFDKTEAQKRLSLNL